MHLTKLTHFFSYCCASVGAWGCHVKQVALDAKRRVNSNDKRRAIGCYVYVSLCLLLHKLRNFVNIHRSHVCDVHGLIFHT